MRGVGGMGAHPGCQCWTPGGGHCGQGPGGCDKLCMENVVTMGDTHHHRSVLQGVPKKMVVSST